MTQQEERAFTAGFIAGMERIMAIRDPGTFPAAPDFREALAKFEGEGLVLPPDEAPLPEGYEWLPPGHRCRCIHSWTAASGRSACCRRRQPCPDTPRHVTPPG